MEKLICPYCGHLWCGDCIDLLDAAPYRRCSNCNRCSPDKDWRVYESSNDRVIPRHWRGVGWDSSKH